MQAAKVYCESSLLFLAGFFLGFYPEFAILTLIIGVLLAFIQNKGKFMSKKASFSTFHKILFCFFLLRLVLAWRQSNIWQGFFDIFGIIALILICNWLLRVRRYIKFLVFGIFFGSISIIFFSVASKLLIANQNKALEWDTNQNSIQVTRNADNLKVRAITSNSWAFQKPILQGSSRVRYQVEVKANRNFETSITFIHSDLPQGRIDNPCFVSQEWYMCSVEADLRKWDFATLGIGGFGKWNTLSPALEVRNPQLVVIVPPNSNQSFGAFLHDAFAAFCLPACF